MDYVCNDKKQFYLCSMYKAVKYRIKDSSTGAILDKWASAVNQVWNYCNEVNQMSWQKFQRPLSGFDLMKLTAGVSKELGIPGRSIQRVCDEYATRAKQFKKRKLNWRSYKKDTGWIPFSTMQFKCLEDGLMFHKTKFKLWEYQPFDEKLIKSGSFSQDARKRWYVSLVIEVQAPAMPEKTGKVVGIDLGLKSLITLSDGTVYDRENLTAKYAEKLAMAQRANKKRLTQTIHAKIKNLRNNFAHEVSREIVDNYDEIYVGNVSSSKLTKTRMAKSVNDAGWFQLKTNLKYKAEQAGKIFVEVNESFSTVTCSTCLERTGPSGLSALGVRSWVCSHCGASHNRDVNAAKNILRSGQCADRLDKGSSFKSSVTKSVKNQRVT